MVATMPLLDPREIAEMPTNRAALYQPQRGGRVYLVAVVALAVAQPYEVTPETLTSGLALLIREGDGRAVLVDYPHAENSAALGINEGEGWSPGLWARCGHPADLWAVARPLLAGLGWLDEKISDAMNYDTMDITRAAGARLGHEMVRGLRQAATLQSPATHD